MAEFYMGITRRPALHPFVSKLMHAVYRELNAQIQVEKALNVMKVLRNA